MSSSDCLKCPLLSTCTAEKALKAKEELVTIDEHGNVVSDGDA